MSHSKNTKKYKWLFTYDEFTVFGSDARSLIGHSKNTLKYK